jgi:hypothetical protein
MDARDKPAHDGKSLLVGRTKPNALIRLAKLALFGNFVFFAIPATR